MVLGLLHPRRRAAAAWLVLALAGARCDCVPPEAGQRFACATSADCADGYVCFALLCVPEGLADAGQPPADAGGQPDDAGLDGGQTGGDDAGDDGGPPDGGPPDAGQPDGDAGRDAGPGDGGLDAGALDAGRDGGFDGGATADAGGGPDAGGGLDGGWWDLRFAHRRALTVQTGTAAIGSGYAVAVTFDHAGLVAAGKARADAADVRVVCGQGNNQVERDRVLDTGSALAAATTTLWFRVAAPVGASASDQRCFLYYGFAAAGAPLATATNVFSYFDGFESGTLANWQMVNGLWQASMGQAHHGQWAMAYPEEANQDRDIFVNPTLNVANVYFDAWWYSTTTNVDVSQLVRASPDGGNNYQTNLEALTGWDIAQSIGFTWVELAANRATPVANVWTRVGVAIAGTQLRVFRNGVQVNPVSGPFDVGVDFPSGTVGFNKWNIGTGSTWFVDDVVVRPYVDPEPTVLVGPEE